MRVLSVFGTRPEAVKMAPVVRELERHPGQLESVVCVTAQHRELLDQVLALFEIVPDIDLDLMEDGQTLPALTARALGALGPVLDKVRPDLVLVQGDTTSAMVAGLAAFYERVAVGHVEAGLRTRSRYRPFPEEMNRRLLGVLASYHFAPTEAAAAALRAEGVPAATVFVTGNPVIDALRWVGSRPPSPAAARDLAELDRPGGDGLRTVLVTAHRRESFGKPLAEVCEALRVLAARNPGIRIVFPVHPNPSVRDLVRRRLAGAPRVQLVAPLPYETLVHVMARSYMILTDSGGLQEEGPALGKPVLVLRDETERPEAVAAGAARVVGTDRELIVAETERLLHDADAYRAMARAVSPFGDGAAARRIVDIIRASGPGR